MTRSTPRNQVNNKRKQSSASWANNNKRNNPRRGGPGILLTCETGRDSKAKRESLEILLHYWSLRNSNASGSNEKTDEPEQKKLSLEDEIAMLKKNKKKDYLLSEYDTGCRGTVSLLCVLPGCALVGAMDKASTKNNETKNDDDDQLTKKQKVDQDVMEAPDNQAAKPEPTEETNEESSKPQQLLPRLYDPSIPTPWDPLEVVQKIITDIQINNTDAPSSRFISRMIPIQGTCYATIDEITDLVGALLDAYLPKTDDPKTFSVAIKRRNCSTVTRDEVITAVYNLVIAKKPNYKVQLKNSAVTVVVEICKTLCGVSVIDDCTARFQNFNIQEFREKANGIACGHAEEEDTEEENVAANGSVNVNAETKE